MIVIPPGSLTMGSSQYSREKPQHDVTISRAFAVGVYHVTRGEYETFVRETGRLSADGCYAWNGQQVAKYAAMTWRDPGFQQTHRDPVVCVSWDDAKAYVEWLNVHLRRLQELSGTSGSGPYRLLTEAEWEYAARGGMKTSYFWGDDANAVCRHANSLDLTGRGKISGLTSTEETVNCADGYVFTSPVGTFPPNGFGLYDMAGDAWQWTEDCWHDDYTGAPTDGSAWTTGDCKLRVIKGGSWGNDSPRLLRPAYRSKYPTGYSDNYAGFRVARTL
jgi:formylglycine-generating enzyme required for sulfatase activity